MGDLHIGVVGPHPEGAEFALELRAFFHNGAGIAEDPVTGSLNASVAQWMLRTGRVSAPYVARQGTAMGRNGRIHVHEADRFGGTAQSAERLGRGDAHAGGIVPKTLQ